MFGVTCKILSAYIVQQRRPPLEEVNLGTPRPPLRGTVNARAGGGGRRRSPTRRGTRAPTRVVVVGFSGEESTRGHPACCSSP